MATNFLPLTISPVQFRKLRKDKVGWAITKIIAFLTMEGSSIRFKQAFKFYKGFVDEILRMWLRVIAKTPDSVEGDLAGVFHHEGLIKAVKHRFFMDFSVMISRVFTNWFKEAVEGSSVATSARSINEEKEGRMKRLNKLKETDDE